METRLSSRLINPSMGIGKRSREGKEPAAAAAAAEEKQKKLYVLFWHGGRDPIVHSLYAIDTPDPDVKYTMPSTKTITTTVSSTGVTKTRIVIDPEEPNRVRLDPVVLRFARQDWGQVMTCVRFGSSLYFMGGGVGSHYERKITYPNNVFILDLSCVSKIPQSKIDRPLEVLSRGLPMQTGKINPISFSDGRKIFVLSGRNVCWCTGEEIHQFEIFCPDDNGGRWVDGKQPPFTDVNDLGPFAIVNNVAIIHTRNTDNVFKFYTYDMDADSWDSLDTDCWTKVDKNAPFHLERGSQFIGDTLYTSYIYSTTAIPLVIPLRKLDPNLSDEEKNRLLPDNKYFDVIKYILPTRELSATLTRYGDRRLCFLQVGHTRGGCGVSVTLFEVFGEGDSAEYLTSAHYLLPDYACEIVAAYIV